MTKYKIDNITRHADGSVTLFFVDPATGWRPYPAEWATKNDPQIGGYLVDNGDGTASYEPPPPEENQTLPAGYAEKLAPVTYREQIATARDLFLDALGRVPGREASIAKTHLETAELWALKAAE